MPGGGKLIPGVRRCGSISALPPAVEQFIFAADPAAYTASSIDFVIQRLFKLLAFCLLAVLVPGDLEAQVPGTGTRPFTTRTPVRPQTRPQQLRPPPRPRNAPAMRRATDLIHRQEPINVSPRLLDQITPEKARVRVSLSKQRAYLLMDDEVVIDSPISSGKRARPTPTGSYRIMQKDKDHRSNIYGDFVDGAGRVVRRGVSSRIDSAPSGTRFVGSPMTWFMRLTDDGVGMHVGILPGYPASHGCIRMPSVAAEMFYRHVKIGTPVVVSD